MPQKLLLIFESLKVDKARLRNLYLFEHVENDPDQESIASYDGYIDDDLFDNNTNIRLMEPSQGPEEIYTPVELDQYFLDPEGLNLVNPFTMNHSDDATAHVGDPEPNQGPFDPG